MRTILIVKPLRHHRFRDREVVPGVAYTMGSADPTASVENLAAVLAADDRDLVRCLAIGCMLGGMYAEYICSKAGYEKSQPAVSADPARIFAAIRELFDRVVQSPSPVIFQKHCEPIDLWDGNGVTAYPSFSEALEAFYPLTKAEKKIQCPAKDPKGRPDPAPPGSRDKEIR